MHVPELGVLPCASSIFQIIEEQTNGSELDANRVEMRAAEHLSSIRQSSSVPSPERELLDGCCCFSAGEGRLQADIMGISISTH